MLKKKQPQLPVRQLVILCKFNVSARALRTKMGANVECNSNMSFCRTWYVMHHCDPQLAMVGPMVSRN